MNVQASLQEGRREGEGQPEQDDKREGKRQPEQDGRREGEGQSEQEVRQEGEGHPEQDGRREDKGQPERDDRREGEGQSGSYDQPIVVTPKGWTTIRKRRLIRLQGEGQPEQDRKRKVLADLINRIKKGQPGNEVTVKRSILEQEVRREGEGEPEQDGRRNKMTDEEVKHNRVLIQKKKKGQPGNVVTLKRFSDYSQWIMAMISGTTMAYYLGRENITKHASSFYFLVSRILLFFTFVTDLALMLLIYSSPVLGGSGELPHIAAANLVRTTGFLTMLASVSFLLLLNRSYAMITMLVFVVMSIVIIVSNKGINTAQASEVTDYEAHQTILRQFFDVSAQVTAAAFGGMISSIFGQFKNLPKNVDQVDVIDFKFTEVFIFFTVIFGLLVMLLTTVPPSLPHPNARLRYITFIRILIHSLLGLLALIGVQVSAEFLGEYIFLAFFPIFLAIGIWFTIELIQQECGKSQVLSAIDHESEPDTSSITISTITFAALMTLYCLYFGSEHNDFHLKTCMFFLSLAFCSSLSWTLPVFRRPRTQSLAMTLKILTYSTIAWLVISVLDLILLAIRSG